MIWFRFKIIRACTKFEVSSSEIPVLTYIKIRNNGFQNLNCAYNKNCLPNLIIKLFALNRVTPFFQYVKQQSVGAKGLD
jgi:hypothetical protein